MQLKVIFIVYNNYLEIFNWNLAIRWTCSFIQRTCRWHFRLVYYWKRAQHFVLCSWWCCKVVGCCDANVHANISLCLVGQSRQQSIEWRSVCTISRHIKISTKTRLLFVLSETTNCVWILIFRWCSFRTCSTNCHCQWQRSIDFVWFKTNESCCSDAKWWTQYTIQLFVVCWRWCFENCCWHTWFLFETIWFEKNFRW